MSGPQAKILPDGQRLHLQHGPIDLIIGAEGDRDTAFAAAWGRFRSILDELIGELPLLRREVGDMPQGAIAQRMTGATLSHAPVFVTPMAAVAGSVAEAVLAAMIQATPLRRAYVNNGGDIAFHLTQGERFRMAIAGLDGAALGRVDVGYGDAARGIASSGQGGRSLSLGIAQTVTVLARSAAEADVAATLIANAVDIPGHPGITRAAASSLQPDSDLASRLVVTHVGALTDSETAEALDRGEAAARAICAKGLALSCALFLNGQSRLTRLPQSLCLPQTLSLDRSLAHA